MENLKDPSSSVMICGMTKLDVLVVKAAEKAMAVSEYKMHLFRIVISTSNATRYRSQR